MKYLLTFTLITSGYSLHAQIDRLEEIRQLIETRYAYDVNIDSILEMMVSNYLNDPETIHELFKHLDPHSDYLDESTYAAFKTDLAGSFYGCGLTLGVASDTVIITGVFENGPAKNAGLLPGDKIVAIDNIIYTGSPEDFDNIVTAIRGESGSTVNFTIIRAGINDPLSIDAIRNKIELNSVNASYMLTKNIGYIKFSYFGERTAEDVRSAIIALKNAGMKKLILDLRDNSGGYFNAARAIADEFLPEKTLVVYTEGRPGTRNDYFTANANLFEKGDVIILVNEATASSAEILAGALQDNHRAVVVGRRTYGKGLVQRLIPLSDSITAVKLTTEEYFTPSGRYIQRPYDEGIDAYNNEYIAILSNGGILSDSMKHNRKIEWGIIPDHYVAEDTNAVNRFYTQLFYRNYLSQAAITYFGMHVAELNQYQNLEDFLNRFTVDDAFISILKEITANSESAEDNYYLPMTYSDELFNASRSKIEIALKAYLAQIYWGEEAFYKMINSIDDEVIAAQKLLK